MKKRKGEGTKETCTKVTVYVAVSARAALILASTLALALVLPAMPTLHAHPTKIL